jgi:hypothetical protein
MDNKTNPDTSKFRELLFSLNLTQHVNVPTHQHGHILDLVITRSSECLVQNLQAQAAVISDHCPLTFNICIEKPVAPRKLVSFRKIKDIDPAEFKQDLAKSEVVVSPANEINDLIRQYNASLLAVLNKHAPVLTKNIVVRPHSPWFNDDIKLAKRARRQAERRWLSSGLTVHLDLLREARLRVNQLCANAKQQFYQMSIEKNRKDQKALFKLTNTLLYKKRDNRLPEHTEPGDLAERFATYFSEKIACIRQLFPTVSHQDCPIQLEACVPQMSQFVPILQNELKKLILSSNSKSCSLDPIPTTLLKESI